MRSLSEASGTEELLRRQGQLQAFDGILGARDRLLSELNLDSPRPNGQDLSPDAMEHDDPEV